MKKSLKILYVSSETFPFAKTGGLADVAGTLPKALHSLGHDVRVFTPYYAAAESAPRCAGKLLSFTVPLGADVHEVAIRSTTLPGSQVPVYFLDYPPFFGRAGIYSEEGVDYRDNDRRFALLAFTALELLRHLKWHPHVIHGNDWQCGLIPLILKLRYSGHRALRHAATVFTIHNMAYQGNFPPSLLDDIGLPRELFHIDGVEFWGRVSFLKAGLLYSHLLNTVSGKYAEEIRTEPAFGMGFEGLLDARKDDLFGIVNGVDYKVWDPAGDRNLPVNYDINSIEKKKSVKRLLREDFNLAQDRDRPVIGIISRLDDQKGFDILYSGLHMIMRQGVQLIILGQGDRKYHRIQEKLPDRYPGQVAIHTEFDNPSAHRIYGGSDMFLMPSRFEPCGLGQLISLRYGTVPIVRKTGGLADTILDYNEDPARGNGFTFVDYSGEALTKAVERAVALYRMQKRWDGLVRRCMSQDWSWSTSAVKYEELYDRAIARARSITCES